jgi:hypothetical protein
MRLDELAERPFDAALCLDAACYLPDRRAALRGIATLLRPGGRLRSSTGAEPSISRPCNTSLILGPLCRYWAIADLETANSYSRSFADAGLRVHRLEDLSDRVVPNWERGYQAALRALAERIRLSELLPAAALAVKHGAVVVHAAKDQFQVALLAKAAADSGLLRYVSVLAERPSELWQSCLDQGSGPGPHGAVGAGHGCGRRTAQRSSWMRTRLPAGSRKAQSRTPYGCSVGSWTTSASLACSRSKVPSRSAVASRMLA